LDGTIDNQAVELYDQLIIPPWAIQPIGQRNEFEKEMSAIERIVKNYASYTEGMTAK
jgi:hypothetical protein